MQLGTELIVTAHYSIVKVIHYIAKSQCKFVFQYTLLLLKNNQVILVCIWCMHEYSTKSVVNAVEC